jgi:hypothetical protein
MGLATFGRSRRIRRSAHAQGDSPPLLASHARRLGSRQCAHATARAKIYVRTKSLFLLFAAVIAEACIHKARLEAEVYRNRCRLRTKSDDDLPIVR